MDHPSQLFSRIRRLQSRPALPRQARSTPIPAPAARQALAPSQPLNAPAPPLAVPPPTAAPAQSPAPPSPTPPSQANAEAPRPARGHALYSQVMRSHDRMGTRHL